MQSDYEAKLEKAVYEYEVKMVEDTISIQTLSDELNVANNCKEELCQRVVAAEIACAKKEVEVGRLDREIIASAAAFNEKVGAEVLAANVAFNEKLAMQALELAAHFDRKLDVDFSYLDGPLVGVVVMVPEVTNARLFSILLAPFIYTCVRFEVF